MKPSVVLRIYWRILSPLSTINYVQVHCSMSI
nr:MAG TPA: hypothetical protein [Caudoviricetes sp.]